MFSQEISPRYRLRDKFIKGLYDQYSKDGIVSLVEKPGSPIPYQFMIIRSKNKNNEIEVIIDEFDNVFKIKKNELDNIDCSQLHLFSDQKTFKLPNKNSTGEVEIKTLPKLLDDEKCSQPRKRYFERIFRIFAHNRVDLVSL